MRPLLQTCRHGAGFCLHCCGSFLCWSLWLLLGLLLVAQIWIASTHTLELPSPLLRLLEHRAARIGLTLRCERVIFTPSGHLQVENFTIGTTSFSDPIIRGRLLRTQIDPWGVLSGYDEARHISVSGIELWTPAPLSASGKASPLLKKIDAEIHVSRKEILLEQFSARCAEATFILSGRLPAEFIIPKQTGATSAEDAWLKEFFTFLRKAGEVRPHLDCLANTRVEIRISPRTEKSLRLDARVWTDQLKVEAPTSIETGPLALSAQLVVGASRNPFVVDVIGADIHFRDTRMADLAARIRGSWQPEEKLLRWKNIDASVRDLVLPQLELPLTSLHAEHTSNQNIRLHAATNIAGAPIDAVASIDENSLEGNADIDIPVTAPLIGWIGNKIHFNILPYAEPQGPSHLRANVSWDSKRQFKRAEGWYYGTSLLTYSVLIDYAHGHVSWDGRNFLGSPAFARVGKNFAYGSYGMDAKTRDFRFLLEGQLRPVEIGGWFKDWWARFWTNFDFNARIPNADVDVQGQWGAGYRTSVFLCAEGRDSIIREVALDRARTRIFLRPHYTDVIEGIAEQKQGTARGWFKRLFDSQADAWRSVDFDIKSTIELQEVARVFGPIGTKVIAPYAFANTPTITAKGHIDGPAAPEGIKENIDFAVDSTGSFHISDFPLTDVSFSGTLQGGDLTLNRITANAAKGKIDAIARVWGPPSERKLAFGGQISGANLGEVIGTIESYAALKTGKSVEKLLSPGRLADTSLDLTINAEGPFLDPLAFTGQGTAKIAGSTLGELKLLGLLSELLPFTSLRFTQAKTEFKLERTQLIFPAVKVTGQNSAIDASGRYLIDKKSLEFNAKVWPFDQSKNVVQGAMGLVLSPLSQALEVKLEGTLAQPKWSFVLSPLGILKSLAAGETEEKTAPQQASPNQAPTEATAQEATKSPKVNAPAP